jgi:hypothetical protein
MISDLGKGSSLIGSVSFGWNCGVDYSAGRDYDRPAILRRVHIVPELIRSQPQLGLKPGIGGW